MTTAMSSYVLIIDLSGDKPRLLRRFDQHRQQEAIVRNRVTAGRTPKVNGHAIVNGDGDVDMEDVASPPASPGTPVEESEDDSDEEETSSAPAVVSVNRIAISEDGQWVATSDTRARTYIFNLDLISVRAAQVLFLDDI